MIAEALQRPHASPPAAAEPVAMRCVRIGRWAVASLRCELELSNKPGLVCPDSVGSHHDMDAALFQRSLRSLQDYFPHIARLGAAGAGFEDLRCAGVAAEAAMLSSTQGINTHRGAIFNLGLLCAAAGRAAASGRRVDAQGLCRTVAEQWGADILASGRAWQRHAVRSHGLAVQCVHGSAGARGEAAHGFPTVLAVGLPTYRRTLSSSGDAARAALQALFALIAALADTNLLWRGGRDGLRFAQDTAAEFLRRGGVMAPNGWQDAARIGERFVARRLSPGGSADLLGVTLFLHRIETAAA